MSTITPVEEFFAVKSFSQSEIKSSRQNKNKNEISRTGIKQQPLSSKKEKIKKRIKELLSTSSAIGIPKTLDSSNMLTRAMWLTCLIAMACLGSYYTLKCILDFLKYETVTSFKMVNERQSQFPTISFCAYPNFNQSHSIENIVVNTRMEGVYQKNFSLLYEEFTDNVYGRCFRFNSGRNMYGEQIPLLNLKASGRLNSVKISIYLDVPKAIDFGEVLVQIHNHSLLPYDMKFGGYFVKPGSWNFFQVERTIIEQLGEPYNNCIKDPLAYTGNKTLIQHINDTNQTYSQINCYRLCSYLYALKESNCNCNSSLKLFDKICIKQFFDIDTPKLTCINNYLKSFRNDEQFEKCSAYCPLECDTVSLTISNYIELFPVSGPISNKSKNDHSIERFNTYEEVNRHFLVLNVFYKEFKYTYIGQEARTEGFTFASNVGGILGLFLGISFMSFLEIAEILIDVFIILYKE